MHMAYVLVPQERRKRLQQASSGASGADSSAAFAPTQAGEHARLFAEDENGVHMEDAQTRRVRRKVSMVVGQHEMAGRPVLCQTGQVVPERVSVIGPRSRFSFFQVPATALFSAWGCLMDA